MKLSTVLTIIICGIAALAGAHRLDRSELFAAADSNSAPTAAVEDPVEVQKQQRAMAGLLALCGIVIGGLMFVLLVMVWGARLRRLARRELPAQKTLQNELWFLKPPKVPKEEEERGLEC